MPIEMLIGVVFLCTVIFVFAVYYLLRSMLSSEQAAVKRRLETAAPIHQSPEYGKQALAFLSERKKEHDYAIFSEFPPLLNLPILFEQAAMTTDVGQWLMFTVGIAGVSGFLSWLLTKKLILGVFVLLISLFLPYFHVLRKRKKRIAAFESNLPQCLDIIGRSLRAGHPFAMGLQMVSTEMPGPVGMEFGRVYNEQQMGLPFEDSLQGMARRVPLMDLRFFVLSIMIHRQTGGDLAEVLDNLSTVIRERFKVLGQIRALTAEGRLSGWVLSLLPVFVMVAIQVINPGYISPLFRPGWSGRNLLYAAGVLQLIGIMIIRKIVNIKV